MKLNNPEDWNELFLPINDNTFGSEQYIENDTDKINAKLKMFIGITQSSDWIGFVEEMLNYCPFVRKRGRPSDENIKNSIIGRSGYKTFTGYLQHELKLKPATWNAWRNAFLLVEDFNYLREIGATSSSINKLNNSLETFPNTAIDWSIALEEAKNKKSATDKQDKAHLMNFLELTQKRLFQVTQEKEAIDKLFLNKRIIHMGLREKYKQANRDIKNLQSQNNIFRKNWKLYEQKYFELVNTKFI